MSPALCIAKKNCNIAQRITCKRFKKVEIKSADCNGNKITEKLLLNKELVVCNNVYLTYIHIQLATSEAQ